MENNLITLCSIFMSTMYLHSSLHYCKLDIPQCYFHQVHEDSSIKGGKDNKQTFSQIQHNLYLFASRFSSPNTQQSYVCNNFLTLTDIHLSIVYYMECFYSIHISLLLVFWIRSVYLIIAKTGIWIVGLSSTVGPDSPLLHLKMKFHK